MARMLFHGTSAQNAAKILKQGFKPRTFFARDLSDAIAFGGSHVFWVLFEKSPFEHADDDVWQVVIADKIHASWIVYLKIYSVETPHYNAKASHRLRTLVLQEEYGPEAELCPICDGHGELGSDDHAGGFVPKVAGKCSVCPTCDGEGSLVALKQRQDMIRRRDAQLRRKKVGAR